MAIRDYSDVYVAACGLAFPNHAMGRDHERICHACLKEIYGEDEGEDRDYEDDFDEEEDE